MTRASGLVSIVIMILLMLVDSERKLFVAELLHLTRQNNVCSTQEVQLVLVHSDGVQGLTQKIFELGYVTFLRLDCFFVLDEGFKRLDEAVCVCHSVSVWVRVWRTGRCDDAPRRSRKGYQTLARELGCRLSVRLCSRLPASQLWCFLSC